MSSKMNETVAILKQTVKEFRQDDLQSQAAVIAYNTLFSVVPLLIFFTALSGFVSRAFGADDSSAKVTQWLFDNLPRTTAQAVEEPITHVIEHQSGGLLSFGALLALWGGKSGVAAMIKGLNVAFGVAETRSWPKRTALSLGLTAAFGVAVVASSLLFLVGSRVGENLADDIGVGQTFIDVWSILRWPLIVLFLLVALAFLYWSGPDVEAPFAWMTPGSILVVVLWGIVTAGLGTYFRYAGSYAAAYGVLGGVLAFIFWLYLMSLIVLIGGELNSIVRREVVASQGALATTHQAEAALTP